MELSPALTRIDCMAADVVNEKACATQPAYIVQVALQSSTPVPRRQYAPANGVAASAENARCPPFGPLRGLRVQEPFEPGVHGWHLQRMVRKMPAL